MPPWAKGGLVRELLDFIAAFCRECCTLALAQVQRWFAAHSCRKEPVLTLCPPEPRHKKDYYLALWTFTFQNLYCMFLIRFLFCFESLVLLECGVSWVESVQCLHLCLVFLCILMLCIPCIPVSNPSCERPVWSLFLDFSLPVWLPDAASDLYVRPPVSYRIKDYAFWTLFFRLAPSFTPGPTLTHTHQTSYCKKRT